jgi:hypothetical protein
MRRLLRGREGIAEKINWNWLKEKNFSIRMGEKIIFFIRKNGRNYDIIY